MTKACQMTLFEDELVNTPSTEGIKYAGSKRKLLPKILELAKKTGAKTVLDGFAGSTRVSQAFAKSGYRVICNDISIWSQTFGNCYLLNRASRSSYVELINHLNRLKPKDGWFTQHYGASADHCDLGAGSLKKPWQIHNTRKLDAIRDEIDELSLSVTEKAVAMTSLILGMDRVDSTLGHYVSYLKDWSPRSFNELRLEVPAVSPNEKDHTVLKQDILLSDPVEADLAYYDPPYGSNNEKMPPSRVRYASYYHVWTSIILNDKPPLFGKALRRKDTSDRVATTAFEEFRRNPETNRFIAIEAIESLIKNTKAKWVMLSYSSGGRATADELNEILHKNGRVVEAVELDHKRHVMGSMKWTHDWVREAEEPNREFLFLLKKKRDLSDSRFLRNPLGSDRDFRTILKRPKQTYSLFW